MILQSHNRQQAVDLVLQAEDGMVLEIRKPKRSLEQNKFYWALLGDISEQIVMGKVYEPSIWHAYFKQLFLPDVMQELPDGSLSVTQPSSTKLSSKHFSEYVDKVMLWAFEHKVRLGDETRSLGEIYGKTKEQNIR